MGDYAKAGFYGGRIDGRGHGGILIESEDPLAYVSKREKCDQVILMQIMECPNGCGQMDSVDYNPYTEP